MVDRDDRLDDEVELMNEIALNFLSSQRVCSPDTELQVRLAERNNYSL